MLSRRRRGGLQRARPITGTDVRAMTPQMLSILINRDVIAVDQDPLVAQGHPLENDPRVWVKPLADGAVAVALTNADATSGAMGTTAGALGLPHSDCYRVRDLWAHTESVASGAIGPVQIPPHSAAMFRVSTCG